jgi:hypothetical protein
MDEKFQQCLRLAKAIVKRYRKSIPTGMEFYNGGAPKQKPPPPTPPPIPPTYGEAAKRASAQRKSPKGFLSTVLSNGSNVDNSANQKSLLGS